MSFNFSIKAAAVADACRASVATRAPWTWAHNLHRSRSPLRHRSAALASQRLGRRMDAAAVHLSWRPAQPVTGRTDPLGRYAAHERHHPRFARRPGSAFRLSHHRGLSRRRTLAPARRRRLHPWSLQPCGDRHAGASGNRVAGLRAEACRCRRRGKNGPYLGGRAGVRNPAGHPHGRLFRAGQSAGLAGTQPQ